jgi:hypothetical protein
MTTGRNWTEHGVERRNVDPFVVIDAIRSRLGLTPLSEGMTEAERAETLDAVAETVRKAKRLDALNGRAGILWDALGQPGREAELAAIELRVAQRVPELAAECDLLRSLNAVQRIEFDATIERCRADLSGIRAELERLGIIPRETDAPCPAGPTCSDGEITTGVRPGAEVGS